jgi:dienelactone hydrolase
MNLPMKKLTLGIYISFICSIVLLASCAYNQDPVKVDKHPAPDTVLFKSTVESTLAGPLKLRGRMKKPAGAGPFPAVVLMHGCGGIQPKRDHRWAERLVAWGYVTLQVDSLGPRGISSVCAYSASDSMDIVNKRVNDAYDAKRYLAQLPFVDRNRIAIMGWSHGGGTILDTLYRNTDNHFQVAVAFYPSCRNTLKGLNAPLLILIGDADDWTPANRCVSALPKEKASPEIILKIYSGAFHGFDTLDANHNVRGSGRSHLLQYHPTAEADSIIQVKAFLEKYLRQGKSI